MHLHDAINAFLALHLLPTALFASPVPSHAAASSSSSPRVRLLTPKDLRVKTRAPAAAPAVAATAPLDERDIDFDPTRNELGECKPVTVIFARGTIELGNVGTFAGPPFFDELDDILGKDNVGVQGVDYPATILGYLEGGDPAGAQTLADLTNQAFSECPNTQIVLGGYSQGAQVVHLGVAKLSAEIASQISAVVLFGDPDKGQALPNIDPSRVDTFCFEFDLICDHLPIVDTYHLSYAVDAKSAAQFVAGLVEV